MQECQVSGILAYNEYFFAVRGIAKETAAAMYPAFCESSFCQAGCGEDE